MGQVIAISGELTDLKAVYGNKARAKLIDTIRNLGGVFTRGVRVKPHPSGWGFTRTQIKGCSMGRPVSKPEW